MYYEPSYTTSNQTHGFGRRSYDDKLTKLLESTLTYQRQFNDSHNFSLMGGYSWQIFPIQWICFLPVETQHLIILAHTILWFSWIMRQTLTQV